MNPASTNVQGKWRRAEEDKQRLEEAEADAEAARKAFARYKEAITADDTEAAIDSPVQEGIIEKQGEVTVPSFKKAARKKKKDIGGILGIKRKHTLV